MWIQLLSVKNIRQHGVMKTYSAGDWVDVGRHLAMNWVANGSARLPDEKTKSSLLVSGAGVVVLNHNRGAEQLLEPYQDGLEICKTDKYGLKYPRTMFWNTEFDLRPELVPIGLMLLDRWDIACPVRNFDILACNVGSGDDQQKTVDVIHDLRVPVYDTRLMFVRRCHDTRELMRLWHEEGGDRDLAFMRALYSIKPLILALPPAWNAKIRWSVR